MAVPLKITGAGNQNTRYVLRITFTQDLMLAPTIEAWDNAETFRLVRLPELRLQKKSLPGQQRMEAYQCCML